VSEPFTAFNFRVEITLPGAAEPLCEAAFAECDGIEMRFDVKTLREGGDNLGGRLIAGPTSFGEVTLRRGMTESFDLWDWCAAVARDPALRADARVVMLSSDGGTEHARFVLRRCLPVRLKGPPLDAARGVVAVEELQLACESLTLERPGGEPGPKPPRVLKAELRELDERLREEINKDRWVQVQLNPRDLRLTRSQADGEAPATARLALELWFDATGEGDVRRLTERVGYFATPRPGEDRKAPGPPGVRFAWGGFRFDGHVEALEETLDVFSADGRPLRARVSLSLRGAT
jgi:phage tail-like protein